MPTTRPETLDFVTRAPLRAVVRRELDAAPEVVFDALADAGGWPRWFPGMDDCRWLTPAPHGVDSQREVRLGPLHVGERFIAWDRPVRWGFTFTRATPPIARAGVELVELAALEGHRTAATYTMALQPPGPDVGVPAPAVRAMEQRLARALAGLDRHLVPRTT